MFACDREKRGANALKEEIDNKSSQNTANSRSCSTIYQDILNVSEDLDMNGKQVKEEQGNLSSEDHYLEDFQTIQQYLADLLQVHTLSCAIRFEPHRPLTVNAEEWWKELHGKMTLTVAKVTLSSTTSNDKYTNALHSNSTTTKYKAILIPILRCLDRINQFQDNKAQGIQDQQPSIDDLYKDLSHAIGFVSCRLICEIWREVKSNESTPPHQSFGMLLINMLLQHTSVGSLHAFHPHVLVRSNVTRVFQKPVASWKCTVCNRMTPSKQNNVRICMYRCAPCGFHLCKECFTRIPNHMEDGTRTSTSSSCIGGISRMKTDSPTSSSSSSPHRMEERVLYRMDNFFQLALNQMAGLSGPATQIVPADILHLDLANAIRWRLMEMPVSNGFEMLPLMEMFLDMAHVKSFMQHLTTSICWMAPFLSGVKVQTLSFLGPFFWFSTITEANLPTNSSNTRGNKFEAMRLKRERQFEAKKVQEMLAQFLKVLLDPEKHSKKTREAVLCWLASCIEANCLRGRLDDAVEESTDGFLINLSAAIVRNALVLTRQLSQYCFEPSQPLYLTPRIYNQENETPVKKIDDCRVEVCKKEHKMSTSECFYPKYTRHMGVVCDVCHTSDLEGVRYKCANCQDYDLCSGCYQTFRQKAIERITNQVANASAYDLFAVDIPFHPFDHVFLKIPVPVSLATSRRFQPFKAVIHASLIPKTHAQMQAEQDDKKWICSVCERLLDQEEMCFQCTSCHEKTRLVCIVCLEKEEEEAENNPNAMHLPCHLYVALPKYWRRLVPLSISEGDMTKVTGPVPLLLKSPMVPPALISPAAIPSPSSLEMEKWELFLMAIRSLHIGPLLTLSRLISVVKEILELRAYCYCEESKQRRKNRAIRRKSETSSSRSDESADDEAVSVSDDCEEEEDEEENRENYRPSRRFAAAGFNRITSSGAHYNMSKSRLEALETTQLSVEIHLLEMDQVLLWFRFYSACCDWLLKLNPSTKTSAAFASFPEHFFFDLCSLMHLLGAVPYVMSGNTEEEPLLVQSLLSEEGTDNCSVLTPLITMLFQLIGNSSITSNPHLRVEALKASCSLMSFLSQYKQSRPVLREIFKSYELQQQHQQSEETEAEEQGVSGSIVEGLVKFHAQMEHYHLRNTDSHLQQGVNGANIPNGPGDIVAIRLCTSLLIRFLWQFPRLRRSFESCMRKNTVSLTGSGLSLLLNGLWSDATRVLEDTTSKIFLLKRLLELQEASLEADSRNNTQLRPAMMEGYVVLHTKQLRLSFRTLIEVLELLNWTMNQSTLKRTLLKPELMDQSARTISFLMITIGKTLDKENSLQEIMEELKLALAFVMFLLVRCGTGGAASTSGLCSETCFWKLSQYAAQRMLCRVGDLDTHARWSINSYVNRLESTKYLGDNMQEQEDDDEVHHDVKTETQSKEIELDEHEALSLLEKQQQQQKATRVKQYDLQKPSSVGAQTEQQLAKTLSKRFISALANDGRFDSKQFMALIHFTRRKRHQRGHNSDMTPEYKYVDAAWVQQFEQSINQAQEMIQVHANIEKLLGDIPQQYLDPLLNTLMTDPVKLPSGHVVDRAVIERHLLSSQSQRVDPFTREPLSLEMLEPCEQLKAEIHMYLMACVKNLEKKEDILATWGVAWNTIFEEEKPPATASNIDPDGQEATIQEEDSK